MDIGAVMRKLGWHPSPEQVLEAMKIIDPDGDSYVEYKKFRKYIKERPGDLGSKLSLNLVSNSVIYHLYGIQMHKPVLYLKTPLGESLFFVSFFYVFLGKTLRIMN